MDEVDPFLQHSLVGDDIGGVAGHEQVLHPRPNRQQPVGQFTAVHFGHDHVGDEQLDVRVFVRGHSHGLAGRCRRENGVPQMLQHQQTHFPHGGIVFHHQDGFALAVRDRIVAVFDCGIGATGMPGQVNIEGRADAGLTVKLDKTLILLDNTVYGGQPQSRALADSLGGKKGFKDVVLGLPIHATTIVADREPNVLPGDTVGIGAARVLVEQYRAGFFGYFADLRDGIPGVDAQVGQDLVQLRGIHAHDAFSGCGQPGQFDVFTDEPAQHFQGALHRGIEVEDHRFNCLFSGEGQDLPGKVG